VQVARIFLCYRSREEAYAAALLDQKLSGVFGPPDVFRAGRCIPPGASYPDVLRSALDACQRLLVLIGPQWAASFRPDEEPAIDAFASSPESVDWVRYEIADALRRNVPILPVLLADAQRPRTTDLPVDVRHLAMRQYVRFRHRNIDADFAQLLHALRLDPTMPLPAAQVARSQPPSAAGDSAEATAEMWADGLVELQASTRDADGRLVGRVTGRLRVADLTAMANLLETIGADLSQPAAPLQLLVAAAAAADAE
jgi:hypothetical protein